MKRKQHSAQFKAKVALEATKGQKTVNQLARMQEARKLLGEGNANEAEHII